MTQVTNIEKRRYRPYEGGTVNICWNSGNDNHADECIAGAKVVRAGATTLWVYAPEDGVKVEQDVFIKYEHITKIERATS